MLPNSSRLIFLFHQDHERKMFFGPIVLQECWRPGTREEVIADQPVNPPIPPKNSSNYCINPTGDISDLIEGQYLHCRHCHFYGMFNQLRQRCSNITSSNIRYFF